MVTYPTTHRLPASERRESIISAAIRLFSERGFRGTTTRELSAAVGVSEPVLYEHFSTKQDLYDAVLERISRDALAELSALMSSHSAQADSASFLRAVAGAIVEWFSGQPEYIRLLVFGALDGEAVSRTFHSRLRSRLVDVIGTYLERHTDESLDPEIVAHAFLCMAAHHGLLQVLINHCPSRPQHEVLDQMVEIFMRGISK